MPSLTLDTATSPHTQEDGLSQSISQSEPSANAPPYSPITPTLSASRPVFTHTSQTPAVAIPQPPPETIDFSTNPDVLALKATISILQQQKRTAERDMKILADTKERALSDPQRFATDLTEGRIGMRGDKLFNPGYEEDSGEEMEDVDAAVHPESAMVKAKDDDKWAPLPTSQNVVRMPPINWEQYGVVGNSLDKLHKDFVARPPEGIPQKMGPDGQFQPGPERTRREYAGVASPYNPFKDHIDKTNSKKPGKR